MISFFLAIGHSIFITFLDTVLNGIKLLPGETDFSKLVVFFRHFLIISST